MGTHPIFESDFDCLTENQMGVEESEELVGPPVPMSNTVGPPVPMSNTEDSKNEEETGPPAAKKRRAVNAAELNLLDNLPAADRYEKSYMHRSQVLYTHVTPKTNFLVTVSTDGHVKFWKKQEQGIEFVKHFRAHLGDITAADCSADGLRYATAAVDQKVK